MTYKNQFVVEVKVNGQILRIRDGSIYLPFECEYSIMLKNLNSKKASVKISIDNKDVLDSHSLIMNPLGVHELKGFLKGTVAKNRFRFIQKTKQIQEHRGDRIDDGLIRVEFAFEKQIKAATYIHQYDPYQVYNNNIPFYRSDVKSSNFNTLGVSACYNSPNVDEGITVKGNIINENYNYDSIGELAPSSVIVISLKGHCSHGVYVQEPITVKRKLECSSCGTKSKSSYKYCPNCGTYLE